MTTTNVRPSDKIIKAIVENEYKDIVPYQWVNWAASKLDLPEIYHAYYPVTCYALWLLYEACLKEYAEIYHPVYQEGGPE